MFSSEDFRRIAEEYYGRESLLLKDKLKDYASGYDRLQNFREIADFLGFTMAEVALCYLMKHIQSIAVAVKMNQANLSWETSDGKEGLKQRIADARNYLLFIDACLEDDKRKRVSKIQAETEPVTTFPPEQRSEMEN